MGYVTYAAAAAAKRTHESDGAHDHDEVFRLDGKQETHQYLAVGIGHSKGEQEAIDRPGGADGAGVQMIAVEDEIGDDDAETGSDAAEEVVVQESPGAPQLFQVAAKHPQGQHIEQDMAESQRVVQEHVGDELPDGEVVHHVLGNKPKRMEQPGIAADYRKVVNDEQGDVTDEQPFHSRGEESGVGKAASAGFNSVGHARRRSSIPEYQMTPGFLKGE